MGFIKRFVQKILPRSLYRSLGIPYHSIVAFVSALWYGFPAKKLVVIGVTGTKGKSSVTEMITAILEEAGHILAVSSTIHFKTGKTTRPNLFKMTLPGRGFIQKLLHDALHEGATHAVIEITSEAAIQNRHAYLYLNALVFTNLDKEHLESHGGMEQYFRAKFKIGESLVHSPKRPRAIVATLDNPYGPRFLELPVEKRIPFSLSDAENILPTATGMTFSFDSVQVDLPQPGDFSVRNALASIKTCAFLGVSVPVSARALAKLSIIKGRAERIEEGQDFLAIVDYAHTPDSLQALYDAYSERPKICVLGNTGGGRDTWKRPDMGRIADENCTEIILTNEDPYDESPEKIVSDMAKGMSRAPHIIMDRREAIAYALSLAKAGDAVLITGKGTDPYIMEANGKKTIWSDAQVVREELLKLRP